MWRRLNIALVTIAVILAGSLLYRFGRSQITAEIYRDRLQTLSRDYQSLLHRYNQAVRKTAVTELVVDGGRLSVAVRTMEGIDRTIPTPFDPSKEIYVDYVVLDGRLWIRRVFDAQTPPGQGLVIDPAQDQINWVNHPPAAFGKAVYRSLSQGRWIVTVSGDGSLGLAQVDRNDPINLTPAPQVRDFPQIEQEVTASVDNITPMQVVHKLLAP